MASSILEVIIDERSHLDQLEDMSFLTMYRPDEEPISTTGHVIKDYILSSEVFQIPHRLN